MLYLGKVGRVMQPLDNEAAQTRLEQYERDLQALMDMALSGQIREDDFRREMERVTVAAILIMYLLGGGDPAKQQSALNAQLLQNSRSIAGLTDDIYSGRYSARDEAESQRPTQTRQEGRQKLLNRIVLWVFALSGIYAIGQTKAPPVNGIEPEYIWELGRTEKHCRDCLWAAGQVLTASQWDRLAAAGIAPQSSSLECQGYHCDCRLRRVR